MSHAWALWLKASIVGAFSAASTAPSPLYGLYREAWHFSTLTLTLVFASYAFALLAALLVFGALSNHRARREVVLIALGLEVGARLLFWQAESVGWLLAARLVQGLATGIATSALSAGLLDLHRDRGALINSVAPMIGMAIGALGTSLLVLRACAHTVGVRNAAARIRVAGVGGGLSAGDRAAPKRRLAVAEAEHRDPAASPRDDVAGVAVNTAQWALGNFYLSLGPTLAREVTELTSPVIGGLLLAALVFCGAVSILLLNQREPRSTLRLGAIVSRSACA